ncbi:MAG: DUF6262 family protein [Cyanobacteria bacterium J06635_15]
MKAKRNTEGLAKSAELKRQECFEKVDKGIKQLLKEKRTINFNAVAEASGVSKAWLYKEPEVKSRIEHLRNQSRQGKRLPRKISASEASLKALNDTLRARVKKLDAENRDLRRQNEVAYAQVIRVRELEKQVERLEAENRRLKATGGTQSVRKPELHSKLESLGVQMNSTLEGLINETPDGIVETAIDSLKEAQSSGNVVNPGGFLNKAIRDCWQPNEGAQQKDELAEFNEWWKWAYDQKLVKAATQINGIQHVPTINDEWVAFEVMEEAVPEG